MPPSGSATCENYATPIFFHERGIACGTTGDRAIWRCPCHRHILYFIQSLVHFEPKIAIFEMVSKSYFQNHSFVNVTISEITNPQMCGFHIRNHNFKITFCQLRVISRKLHENFEFGLKKNHYFLCQINKNWNKSS